MRLLCTSLLVAALSWIPQSPAPPRLTGRVVTDTGRELKPVRRAQVRLTGGALTAPRIADTDTNGAYRFQTLPPGDYKVSIQKPGYVTLETAAAPGATVTMVRGSAIEGIVRDPSGEPIWNVPVMAIQREETRPRIVAQVRTDDLGRYRLHSLPAGDYYVAAESDRQYLQRVAVRPGEKAPPSERAYYPAAATIDESRPVRLLTGRDATAIDLTLALSAPQKDPEAPPQPPRPDATGTARITGRVIDASTGKPIRNASVLLLPVDGQRLTNWTRTDAQGRFDYPSLIARRYTLQASASRYVTLEYGQKRANESGVPIQVKDGETFSADMMLTKASAVEGTIVDEFGDPAPGVSVQIARRIFAAGRHRIVSSQNPTPPTDDLGHYRLSGVPPCECFVLALAGVYAEENGAAGFAPTYYPGTMDARSAATITVGPTGDVQVSFAMVAAPTVTIGGTMVNADGHPVSGRGTLWLATSDKLQQLDFNLARTTTAADGRFVLRNVPAGTYTLQGYGPPPPDYRGPGNLAAMRFGWLPLSVGDTGMDDVVLTVTDGTTLRGRIVLEDSTAKAPTADEVRVNAVPVEFDSAPVAGGPAPSETHDDLSFEVKKLSGLRRILVSTSTPAWTLKKITIDGIDATDKPVDFRTKNVENVEVLLTSRITRISGTASNDKGPVTDYTVVIFSTDPTKWVDRSRFVQLARPTQQGAFDVAGLPPDEYLVIALPSVTGPEWQDPDFLQQLRAHATPIVLNEGESRVLDLKIQRRP